MAIAPDRHNEVFQLAVELVNQSNRNIFLTGKAGTGKTTFLRYIKDNSLKQVAVVAPTGVAAINAGGTTIHSFFQLPFSPYLPEMAGPGGDQSTNRHTLLAKIKLNRDRIKVLRQLELLVIDEISMVRCDVLDAIDLVLRHFRHRHTEPFGGVQVLFIGDMFQLPPVAVDQEWNLLSACYDSPYFFDSRIMRQAPPVYLEFKKIYRQRDGKFIELLNEVRNNALSDRGRAVLESLYDPDFRAGDAEEYIVLTTHNHKADAINAAALSKLATRPFHFRAEVEGEFSEKAYPADQLLQLKEGARVMFIKNDKEKQRRYYNGKIGVVSRITDSGIFVQCRDEADEIEVQQETWENIRYSVNPTNNQLEENVVGAFKQYPLRLAWAITIHKSQGLTFEKAVIDAGAAFASGQVYVALSRCTSLEGLILKSRLNTSSLSTDERIVAFSSNPPDLPQLKTELQASKKMFQQELLLNLFAFNGLRQAQLELKKLVEANAKDFNDALQPWCLELENKIACLSEVAAKFGSHLAHYFSSDLLPGDHPELQARLKDAAVFFGRQLKELNTAITASPAVTDSKTQAKAYNDALKDLFGLVCEKLHLLEGLENGFNLEAFYSRKKNFVLPPFMVNAYATGAADARPVSAHPALHYQLRQIRNRICEETGQPVYIVASTRSIDEMVQFLPQEKEELLLLSGFGKAKTEKYGEAFLKAIREYCAANGLSSHVHEKPPSRKRKEPKPRAEKVDTKALSFQLYQQGKNVAEIAADRNLTVTTIEGHLVPYVQNGEIAITDLVPADKLLLIAQQLGDYEDGTALSPLISRLQNKVSYGELRLALAARAWEKSRGL